MPHVCTAAVQGQREGVKGSAAGGKDQTPREAKSQEANSSSRFRHKPATTTAGSDEGNGTKKFNNLLYLCSTFHPQSILRT